jgi:hypothetical protein
MAKITGACAWLVLATLGAPAAAQDVFLHSVRDFDGDGREDLVSVCDGAVWIQLMNGTTVADAGSVGDGGGAWTLRAIGDLDGDGDSDLVFEGASFVRIVLMDGVAMQQEGFVSNGDGAWAFRALADVNGDGNADLLLENATHVRIDLMNGVASTSRGWVSTAGGAFPFRFAADVSGDGKADLIGEGANHARVQLLDGTSVTSTGWISNAQGAWDLDAYGDFDGDGKEDLRFTRVENSRYRYYRSDRMDGTAAVARTYAYAPATAWFRGVGDVNGIGIAQNVSGYNERGPWWNPILFSYLAFEAPTSMEAGRRFLTPPYTARVLGDFDFDGDLDVTREDGSSYVTELIGLSQTAPVTASAANPKPDLSCELFR